MLHADSSTKSPTVCKGRTCRDFVVSTCQGLGRGGVPCCLFLEKERNVTLMLTPGVNFVLLHLSHEVRTSQPALISPQAQAPKFPHGWLKISGWKLSVREVIHPRHL